MVRAWITKKASSFGTFTYELSCMEETIQAYNMAGIERLLLIIISIFISNRTVNCLAQSLLSVRQSQHHQKSVATHKAPSWELFRKKITKCQSIKQGRDIFFLFFSSIVGARELRLIHPLSCSHQYLFEKLPHQSQKSWHHKQPNSPKNPKAVCYCDFPIKSKGDERISSWLKEKSTQWLQMNFILKFIFPANDIPTGLRIKFASGMIINPILLMIRVIQ